MEAGATRDAVNAVEAAEQSCRGDRVPVPAAAGAEAANQPWRPWRIVGSPRGAQINVVVGRWPRSTLFSSGGHLTFLIVFYFHFLSSSYFLLLREWDHALLEV